MLVVTGAAVLAVQACADGPAAPSDDEVSSYAEALPPTGESVKFFFYTHCGVENARIGGRWWHVAEPLYGEGGEGVGPPDGWDNPYQEGQFTVESSDRAVFEARDTTVLLFPSATGRPVRVCR